LELFRTDFTPEGTYMVADLNKNQTTTGTANGSPDIFCEFDGFFYESCNWQ
jgi:ELWxxDGT repeat protein